MKIELKETLNRGRGIFAKSNIKKGEVIETCPVILIPMNEKDHINKTNLKNYFYDFDKKNICIVLGYGSIYNHSFNANSEWDEEFTGLFFVLRAIRNIKKGEEILVNYGGDFDSKDKVWFEVK